jgi:hypothetical protein
MKNRILMLALMTVGMVVSWSFMAPQATGPFEGTINFNKTTGSTVQKYKYVVKDEKIRIEDFGTDGTLQGVMLVNTKTNKVYSLSPDRKLYMDMPSKSPKSDQKITLKKTTNSKTVEGYKCTEWQAVCEDEKRVISYWMAEGGFEFFIPLLKTLNRKDKLAVYFLKLEGTAGMFPMIGTEKKNDGTVISELKVTGIKKETIKDVTVFDIPKGYSKFEKK